MGGRGASSGISRSGNPYGSEYYTVLQHGNIKFVKSYDEKHNNKATMETMTKGRIYGYVNSNWEPKGSFFCVFKNGKKIKKICGMVEMKKIQKICGRVIG